MIADRIISLRESVADPEIDRGFRCLLALQLRDRLREQRLVRRLLADNPDAIGTELRNRRGQYVAILPEPDGSDRARIVRFGEDGFFGHEVYPDPVAALEEAVGEGYTEVSNGTLDQLAQTQRWHKGMQYGELIRKVNAGQLTYAEFGHATNALYAQ